MDRGTFKIGGTRSGGHDQLNIARGTREGQKGQRTRLEEQGLGNMVKVKKIGQSC
jgi:hypothetical protein